MDCSLPGSSFHGILQARVLEWVAISFSRGSFWPRDWIRVSRIPGRCFNLWATREATRLRFKFWVGPNLHIRDTDPKVRRVECWGTEIKAKYSRALSPQLFVVVVQSLSCVQFCDPMDCSKPGFPVLHHLLNSFSSVQSLSRVQLFVTPWTAARQASLSITNSQSLLKLMFIESVMAIQPSHPLPSPSPPAFDISQHQGLFKWVSSSHQVAKVLEFQLQHQSFQ